MAIFYECDGCHEPVREPERRGIAITRDYCPVCIAVVDLYLKKVDKVHDAACLVFEQGVDDLRKSLDSRFHLPDVPTPESYEDG